MAKTLNNGRKSLSATKEETMPIRLVRGDRSLTQMDVAESLGVNQAAVSKMEGRSGISVSSLRKFVEAMGGELEVKAKFPDKSYAIAVDAKHQAAAGDEE